MVKFGAFIENPVKHDVLGKTVVEMERLGFDSVWLEDHLVYVPGLHYMRAHKVIPLSVMAPSALECLTTLSWLAGQTRKIRLGSLVVCALFRNPALLAKMGATLDVVSNGRLELGLGGGYWKIEFDMYGIRFPKHSTRIEMLAETVQILKEMWTKETADFEGKHYRVKGALNNPKPVQKPHPPITIGGKGEKIMKVAARLANSWNLPSPWALQPEEYRKQVELFNQYCREAGRPPSDVVKSLGVRCLIDKDGDTAREKAKRYKPDHETLDYFMKRLIGTPEQCVEKLNGLKAKGAEYFTVHFYEPTDFNQLKLFAEKVIPAVK